MNCSSVHSILHNELEMRKVCSEFIPMVLITEQKTTRVKMYQLLLEMFTMQHCSAGSSPKMKVGFISKTPAPNAKQCNGNIMVLQGTRKRTCPNQN